MKIRDLLFIIINGITNTELTDDDLIDTNWYDHKDKLQSCYPPDDGNCKVNNYTSISLS